MSERTFRLFDTETRTVKALVPSEPGHLRFYSCGPTVYSYAHIGNFRTFLTADLIVRTANAIGWRVSYVSNITDVGHLTTDDQADASGDDKMERALRSKEGEQFQNVWELASHYATAFQQDWDQLGLRRPLVWPRATEHMREQILAVEKLIADGFAYEAPTGVYFDSSKFARRGALSGNTELDSLKSGVREVVLDDNKRHQADFALWKKDDKHLMQWYSPWGWGFPGWHIECSVMAMAYLGETIDLHGGGEDLIFPHHECELAQSESLTGKPFANHWIHTKFLSVEGEKMAKSKGNFFTVRELVNDKGIHPLALRYALISVPYGKPANFTMELLRDSEAKVMRYDECRRIADAAIERGLPGPDSLSATLDELYEGALAAMLEDLNTSVALAKALEGTGVIFRDGTTMSAASGEAALRYLERVGDLLGIVPFEASTAAKGVDEALIQQKVDERAAAKAARDFARADAIRDELAAMGVELRDTPNGVEWRLSRAL